MPEMYEKLCAFANLYLAYKKARKGKSKKKYVIDFEADWINNLLQLQKELVTQTYRPRPLQEFIIHDPKTRRINRSAFRDRIVHHALCNLIGPLFEKSFIFDSYANRIGKGAFKAIARYQLFLRKASLNYSRDVYVLKTDIRKYFETVPHNILISIIQKKIDDPKVIWLIETILSNYNTDKTGIGMPLGNLTSQFFANVYLNELDQFVKHVLKAEYYIRYVDDFVVIDASRKVIENFKWQISEFLTKKLVLHPHPTKSKIILAQRGVDFLGMRVFLHYKLLKKKNLAKFQRKCQQIFQQYDNREITYDPIYDFMEGWIAYAKNANTYNLRRRIAASFEERFPYEISSKEVNRARSKQKKKSSEVVTPPPVPNPKFSP